VRLRAIRFGYDSWDSAKAFTPHVWQMPGPRWSNRSGLLPHPSGGAAFCSAVWGFKQTQAAAVDIVAAHISKRHGIPAPLYLAVAVF